MTRRAPPCYDDRMSFLDSLQEHLDPKTIGSIASKLGIDPAQAQSAVASALPAIVGALAKNSAHPAGAAALDQALTKDHDGSIFEQLSAVAPKLAEDGQKILGHMFGDKKAATTEGVAAKSGLPIEAVTNILGTLAPIVMGAIGKKKKDEGLDAAGVAAALGHAADASAPSADVSAPAASDASGGFTPAEGLQSSSEMPDA